VGGRRDRVRDGRGAAGRHPRNNLGAELAKLVDIDPPESLVSGEMQARLQNLAQQLGASGIRIEDWMQITGRDPEAFAEELRGAAEEAVKVDLALRAVVVAEGMEVTDAELEEEVVAMIGGMDLSIEDAIEQLRSGGQLSALRSDIAKRKALEWLVEQSEVVDEDGEPVPDELLQPPAEHDHSDHDHDHDHDHD
jgi:trigger factor